MSVLARALCGAALAAGPLAAQSPSAPPVGARVRVETRGGERLVGTVVALDADTLRLAARPGAAVPPRAVPVAGVRAYAVAAGRARWRGAGRGALVGGALGLVLVGVAAYADATASDVIIPATFTAVPAALALTGLGAGVGALAAPRRWSPGAPLRLGAGRDPRGALRAGIVVGARF